MYLKVATWLEYDKIYYQKAKEIVTNLSENSDPLQTARLYFKLGQAQLWSGTEVDDVLDCYLECLHIQQKVLPENDLSIALTYSKIAELHRNHDGGGHQTSLYPVYASIAEFFMKKCLSMQLKTLPATHPELATTYYWFGKFYLQTSSRNTALALENFEKAKVFFRQ
jgi:hypothetical protein